MSPKVEITLREPLEVQFAHDTLLAMLTGDVPVPVDPSTRSRIAIACDVLCWVLKHQHNGEFEKNLEGLRNQMKAAGYREQVLPVMTTLEKLRQKH